MNVGRIADNYGISLKDLERFIYTEKIPHKTDIVTNHYIVKDSDVPDIVRRYKAWAGIDTTKNNRAAECALDDSIFLATSMLLGDKKVVKNLGVITADENIQIVKDGMLDTSKGNGKSVFAESIEIVRKSAIAKMQKRAKELGANAIIDLDLTYITIDSDAANISGRATLMPYVICMTAIGDAVIIE